MAISGSLGCGSGEKAPSPPQSAVAAHFGHFDLGGREAVDGAELDRLSTHVSEVRRVLKAGGAAGRRLDFLMQELNREANTLGSKAFDPRSTQAAVNLKVLIEQMREQVQNIE